MSKTPMIPIFTAFFLFICLVIGLSFSKQEIRNTLWIMANSGTVKTTINWFPCIVIAIPLTLFTAWTFNLSLNSYKDDQPLDIGDDVHMVEEIADDGSYVGYRYLDVTKNGYQSVTDEGLRRNGKHWGTAGYLESHELPMEGNDSGIYAAKTRFSPILQGYKRPGRHKVKVRLWGESVAVGKRGYRSHKALVVEDYGEE